MNYILKNGTIINPAQNTIQQGDIAVNQGRIAAQADADARVIDCSGKWVVPGLIDMHAHLREPGEEYKETIYSGTAAAAAGGFTAVACMPDTNPVNDNGTVTRFIMAQAAECPVRVYPVGAISHQLDGKRLAEMAEMKEEGVVAVSDGDKAVTDSQLMRRGMEYASSHNLTVISHPEDRALSRSGCMNEGALSTRMGLKGIPAAAEAIMVQREIALAQLTGARLHLAHISTAQSINLIRSAKEKGINVTAATAPHYFTLTEKAVAGYNTNAKVNPPLRTEADRKAVRTALADGTIDAIATDHAPHSCEEKDVEFALAANGIASFESALGLSLALVHENLLTAARLVELMSVNPARILGVTGGSLAIGEHADITIINPDKSWVFQVDKTLSKGKNSPFDGWQMRGFAEMILVGGKLTQCRPAK